MTSLTILVAITIAAVGVMLFVAFGFHVTLRPSRPPTPAAKDLRDDMFSLAADLELPSYTLAQGISEAADFAYVRARLPKGRRAFLHDRKRLAKLWLKENREQLRRLLLLHRLIARFSENLSVQSELRMICGYLALQTTLMLADVTVSLAGPLQVRRLGLLVAKTFRGFSDTVADAAATLDSAKRAAIRENWAQMAQTM